jgi:hypothetical protein
MSEQRIQWAEAQIIEQDKIIAEAEATKAAALSRKSDLQAFIRVERDQANVRERAAASSPVLSALNAAAESFDASQRGAKKRAILATLDAYAAPMTTQAILAQLPAFGVTGAAVENTSPQLSAYKADGLVELTDAGWQITGKGRKYLQED